MNRYKPQEQKGVSKLIIALLILGVIAVWFYLNDQSENAVDVIKIDIPKENQSESSVQPAQTVNQITDQELENQPQQTQVQAAINQSSQFEDSSSKKQPMLPSLANSDIAFTAALKPVSAELVKWFSTKNVIKKYIVLINDLSQGQMLYKHRRFLKAPGKFIATGDAQGLYLTEQSYRRYDSLANAIEAIDVEKGSQLYLKFRPLFEKVYKEFSYSDEYALEDIFLKAAANVIGAPVIEGRIDLLQYSVRYKFADKKLESLSHIEKQMLRMGPENTRKIQRKLRKLVQAITVLSE